MTRRRGICAVVALLVAGWLLGAPGAALAVKERQPLNENPCGSGGPTVGKVVIKDLKSGGVKVKVVMKSGDPNTALPIPWIGKDAPGCVYNGCGSILLGTMLVDGLGKGRFVIELPGGNPFPGCFVGTYMEGTHHSYGALFDNIFQ